MKKTLLFFLITLLIFNANAQVNNCESRTVSVSNLTELHRELNAMIANSGTISTTLVLKNGDYGNKDIHWSDQGEIGLWRDINPKGGCPCEIKAEREGEVSLYGKLYWKIQNAKNLTINGIRFVKTKKHFAEALIEISGTSSNVKIKNCEFEEFHDSRTPTITGGFFDDPDPTNNYNYYVHFSGHNNIIEGSKFLSKYSNGSYINMFNARDNEIIKCEFTEEGERNEAQMKWCDKRDFVFLTEAVRSTISGCKFRSKKTKGHYVNFNGGEENSVEDSLFEEKEDDYASANLEEPLYNGFNSNVSYVNFFKGKKNKAKDNSFLSKRIYGNYIDASVYGNGNNEHLIKGNKFSNLELGDCDSCKASFIKLGSCGAEHSTAEINAKITVENNVFENYNSGQHNYYETISNKSSGNHFKGNTFINCNGALKLRCGNNCTVEANRFIGEDSNQNFMFMDGIDISGKGHVIFNNYFEGLTRYPISLVSGNNRSHTKDFSYTPIDSLVLSFNTVVNCKYNILLKKYPNHGAVIVPKNSKIDNNIFHYTIQSSNAFFSLYPLDGFSDKDRGEWDTNLIRKNIYYYKRKPNFKRKIIDKEKIFKGAFKDSIFGDPKLEKSSTTVYFVPKNGSSAEKKAFMSKYYKGLVTLDIDSVPRNVRELDIGCNKIIDTSMNLYRNANSNINNTIKFYPNPIGNSIHVECSDCEILRVEILDGLGKTYFKKTYPSLNKINIDLYNVNFSKGVYFLKVDSKRFSQNSIILKN